jgi:NAD(P)-dependent dehydrogenase (short-subunit alcohol dehydrogenase family)
MDLQLKGKLALVSGSTAGIGFASARALAAEGARVIANGRTEARVAEAAEKIRRAHPPAELELFAADLSQAGAAAAALERFDRVDVLVNNLGVYEPKPFEKITDADWHAMIETNFLSGVRLSRAGSRR